MRKLCVVLAVIGLVATLGFGDVGRETPPGTGLWTLGMGSGFVAGSPMFDGFLQVRLVPGYLDMRVTASVFRIGAPTELSFSASLLLTPWLGGTGFYLGGGVGGLVEIDAGVATGILAGEALAGMDIPLTQRLGFYGQVRFLGWMGSGYINGYIIPGLGLYLLL